MDRLYTYPHELLENIRKQKPWMTDPKYFKKVKICPSASIKMLTHGQQGVEKGIRKSGKPIEVMGLLMGRPDVEDVHSLIITDAFPLPIEGFETRVVADDNNVMNYMIDLGEAMELTRHERFCGWYHTHPFDLDGTSHCFLSNTDITTQLQWQRGEDPHGNPWLAIVIDPLYSLAKQNPEIMAFRVYPPEYSAPVDETPNGQIVKDDQKRVAQWGACWNRYYKLDVEYFMSSMTNGTLNALRNQFLWYNCLCAPTSSSPKKGALDRVIQQVTNLKRYPYETGDVNSLLDATPESTSKERGVRGVVRPVQSIASEQCCNLNLHFIKHALFRTVNHSYEEPSHGEQLSAEEGKMAIVEESTTN